MSRFEAEQARLRAQMEQAPPPYQDKVMEGSDTDDDDTASTLNSADAEGVRAWLFESRAGWSRTSASGMDATRGGEAGVRTEYRRETLNYGDLLFQFDGRTQQGEGMTGGGGTGSAGQAAAVSSGRINLRMVGMPLTPRRFADVTVGDFYAERTEGLSGQERLALPTTPLRGASVRLFDADGELRLGAGERGWMTGGPYPGFERSQGSRGWLGLSRRLGTGSFVAMQVERADKVPAYYTDPLTGQGQGTKDVSSLAVSTGMNAGPLREGAPRLRGTLLASSVASSTAGVVRGSAVGLFTEGALRLGAYRHSMSAYVATPNLHFGDGLLLSGVRGGHWRVDYAAGLLSAGLGLEVDRSLVDVSRAGPQRTRRAVTANAQSLVGRDSAVGGQLYATDSHQGASSTLDALSMNFMQSPASGQRALSATVYTQTRVLGLPRSRISLSMQRNVLVAANSEAATGQELQWEQDWLDSRTADPGSELTTSLGYARDESGGSTRRYPTVGLQVRTRLGSTLELQGSLRYSARGSDLFTSQGLSGNLGLEQYLGQGWRLGAALSLNQARFAMVQTSLDAPQVYRSNDKSLYVFLRWQGQSGRAFSPLGGRGPEAGSGDIEGRVFFDVNRDGRIQPGEDGAGGVEVLLDGRYRTTTDREGRFEFRTVSTGRHQISVAPESVPLPWVEAESVVSVEVPLRGVASSRVPLVRGAP